MVVFIARRSQPLVKETFSGAVAPVARSQTAVGGVQLGGVAELSFEVSVGRDEVLEDVRPGFEVRFLECLALVSVAEGSL